MHVNQYYVQMQVLVLIIIQIVIILWINVQFKIVQVVVQLVHVVMHN